MEEQYFSNDYKCVLLVVDKTKSFDKNMNGDFNLKKNILDRNINDKKHNDQKYNDINDHKYNDL